MERWERRKGGMRKDEGKEREKERYPTIIPPTHLLEIDFLKILVFRHWILKQERLFLKNK